MWNFGGKLLTRLQMLSYGGAFWPEIMGDMVLASHQDIWAN